MKVYAISDRGKVRPINEDSYYLPRDAEQFCAVADGMGGHNAGEVASKMAVEQFADAMREVKKISGMTMRNAILRANEAIYAEGQRDAQKSGMGTTFTALAKEHRHIHIAHVGDSRAYLIRKGTAMRLTLDHTLVEEMILQGVISPQEAKTHPQRNIITRALGADETVDVDLIDLDYCKGDVFFLCTDGLSNHVEEKDILAATESDVTWQEKLQSLVDIAMKAGGSDNITGMYVTFEEDTNA